MSGLINNSKLKDPVLRQIEKGVDQKVPPQARKDYLAIVVAGMKIIFHSEMNKRITDKLKVTTDLKSDVSQGVANIIAMVFHEASKNMSDARKTAFVVAAMPAGITLMCQLLDYFENITGNHLTKEMIAEVAHTTSGALLRKFNIDEAQVKQAVSDGQKKRA